MIFFFLFVRPFESTTTAFCLWSSWSKIPSKSSNETCWFLLASEARLLSSKIYYFSRKLSSSFSVPKMSLPLFFSSWIIFWHFLSSQIKLKIEPSAKDSCPIPPNRKSLSPIESVWILTLNETRKIVALTWAQEPNLHSAPCHVLKI